MLHSLGPEDMARVEEHLETCQWCRALLRQHGRVVEALAHAAPRVEPDPSIKQGLLAQIDAHRAPPRAIPRKFLTAPRLVGSAAAAVVILVLAGVIALEVRSSGQVDDLRSENAALASQLEGMSESNASLAAKLEEMSQDNTQLFDLVSTQLLDRSQQDESALATLVSQRDREVGEMLRQQRLLAYMVASLSGDELVLQWDPSGSPAHGTLIVTGEGYTGVLVAGGLQPLASDRDYQVWLWDGREVFSGGLLLVDDSGWGYTTFRSTAPIASLTQIGVTRERRGGSPWPTEDPVLMGEMNPE